MSEYKVSVLITFYNQIKYVDDAMKSVINQKTTFPFCVLIGDDGSTDGTIDRIKYWINKYPDIISLYVQERDLHVKYLKGVRAGRNRVSLMKRVDTPYFIYLDGDDYWTDECKLQKQYDILEKKENENCVGCGHYIRAYNEKEKDITKLLPREKCKRGKYTLRKYLNGYYFHTDTILFRSDYIDRLPFDLVEDSFNDSLITFCFLQFGDLYFLDECMADYRMNDQGIWAGEKKAIGIIREMLMHDIELKINPRVKILLICRHLDDFEMSMKEKDLFNEVDNEYLELAKRYGCQTAERALVKESLFSDSMIIDKVILLYFKAIRKILRGTSFFEKGK